MAALGQLKYMYDPRASCSDPVDKPRGDSHTGHCKEEIRCIVFSGGGDLDRPSGFILGKIENAHHREWRNRSNRLSNTQQWESGFSGWRYREKVRNTMRICSVMPFM